MVAVDISSFKELTQNQCRLLHASPFSSPQFDSEPGERFRKACAEYCRNQSFALDALKRHRRKDQRLSQFLGVRPTTLTVPRV